MSQIHLADRVSQLTAPDDVLGLTESFISQIRTRAPAMYSAGRLDHDLIESMDEAGLYSLLVPARFGGRAVHPSEANSVVERLGNADPSTAWVSSFFMLHNFLLCRYPMEAQEELFDGRSSVRAAAVWAPPGKAERVSGGYRVTGRWSYASGIYHSSHALVPAKLDDVVYWFIVKRDQLTVLDDWDMAAMAATGSATIQAEDVFVAEPMGYPLSDLLSADRHGGTAHPEAIYRYPFAVVRLLTPSLTVGALDRAVELFREKLRTSKTNGISRIDRCPSRIRWVEAYETARIVRMLRDTAQAQVMEFFDSGKSQTLESEAELGLHSLRLIQTAMQAVRSIVDGSGSSVYKRSDELQKIATDLSMMGTHAVFSDYDVVIDRHARWVLGMGLSPEDPPIRLS